MYRFIYKLILFVYHNTKTSIYMFSNYDFTLRCLTYSCTCAPKILPRLHQLNTDLSKIRTMLKIHSLPLTSWWTSYPSIPCKTSLNLVQHLDMICQKDKTSKQSYINQDHTQLQIKDQWDLCWFGQILQ